MKSIILAALALLSATAGAGDKSMNGVSEQVQVDAGGGKVVVRLKADNRGARPVYVPKELFQDGELVRPVFEIRDAATGAEVEYIGRKVKRGPITKDDYVALKPGASKTNSIDITRSYDFQPGQHTYQLSYAGSYLNDLAALDAATPVAVAPATFTFKK